MKVTTQFNHRGLPPLIKIHQLSHNFLNSISTNILETIRWSEDESIHDSEIRNNPSSNCSKSSSTPPDNPHILQYKYPILDFHNIDTSNLNDDPLDIMHLKNLLSEVTYVLKDNNINMNLEKWYRRGKK